MIAPSNASFSHLKCEPGQLDHIFKAVQRVAALVFDAPGATSAWADARAQVVEVEPTRTTTGGVFLTVTEHSVDLETPWGLWKVGRPGASANLDLRNAVIAHLRANGVALRNSTPVADGRLFQVRAVSDIEGLPFPEMVFPDDIRNPEALAADWRARTTRLSAT